MISVSSVGMQHSGASSKSLWMFTRFSGMPYCTTSTQMLEEVVHGCELHWMNGHWSVLC